jgi:DNA-binding GntR family transcriptional regulator
MLWLLSVIGIMAVFGLAAALVWAVRELVWGSAARRLERRLDPADVVEINQAFARIERDVLYGD